ncbi:NAD-binding protein [Halodesulfurarchaeum sp.]|uniref:NAD-binding protein n=1 Tax=Halodesulfurarchaeum sp. TaxID=1980530 RepID=UPI001BBD280E|nr:NAD-binding protein [Halodesulfurarchaeum sp.]
MGPGDDQERESDDALERLFYHTDRVTFVHWGEFTGAKTATGLVGVLAVLSFVVGLSHISQPAQSLEGPLATVLPLPPAIQFVGVLFAFVFAVLTAALRRRKRLGLLVTIVVLPLVAVLPLVSFQNTDIPLLLVLLITLPLLLLNREKFDQPIEVTPLQIASLSSVVLVGVYGTVGAYTLRNEYVTLETWGDAVYYVIVTVATVGYGDMTPTTPTAKWFSLSVIIFGTGAFTVAIGSLIVPAIESRMASAFGKMTGSELKLFEDHIIVLGYSDVTESLLEELEGDVDVGLVTEDEDVAREYGEEVTILQADPTDESSIRDANIEAAKGVVVATEDDADNVLAVLTARRVDPDIRIVATGNEAGHLDKLEAVGADEVVSPQAIGGRLLGQSVLGKSSPESLFERIDENME